MALVEKAFGDIITFTRASGGGRINALGQYEWVGNDVPRLTHDPVTLQPLGLLVEEQRTNLLKNSVLAGGTSGVVGSGAVAPTNWTFQAPTPSGEITFVTTSPGTPGIRFQATSQRPAIGRSVSVLANTVYYFSARVTDMSGTLTLSNALWVTGLPAGASIAYWRNGVDNVAPNTVLGAGDYIAVIVTVGATAGTITARFGSGAQTNATCDCTMTMPQVEVGPPSTYIPTEASQVTRAADMCSVNTLSPWYNATKGTLVVEYIPQSKGNTNNYVWTLRTGGTDAGMIRVWSPFGPASTISASAGSSGAVTRAGNSGVTIMAALAWADGGSASFSSNNGAPVSVAPSATTVPASPILNIGSYNGSSSQLSGIIASITYYPRVIDVQQASA